MARSTFQRAKVKDTPQDPDQELRATLRAYSTAHPCHGFRRAHAYLVHDVGMEINLKKVQRLWREEGLTRKTPRRQVRRGKTTMPVVKANEPNHVWSIDFQYDVTRDGRPIKIASMVDEFTRESLLDIVERSIDADQLAKALTTVFAARGVPRVLRMDNGPEFISKRLQRLCGKRIGMAYIPPGTPWNNGYVESFNNHRRRECLRRHDFANLIEARHTITEFHRDYNLHHRHSSLGYLTPVEYAEQWKTTHTL